LAKIDGKSKVRFEGTSSKSHMSGNAL